jgi:hypothetical protein
MVWDGSGISRGDRSHAKRHLDCQQPSPFGKMRHEFFGHILFLVLYHPGPRIDFSDLWWLDILFLFTKRIGAGALLDWNCHIRRLSIVFHSQERPNIAAGKVNHCQFRPDGAWSGRSAA